MPTGRGQKHAYSETKDEEAHGVLRHHAEADDGTNGNPPAWIVRVQQADDEIGQQDAPEVVEGNVLQDVRLDGDDGDYCNCDCGEDLRFASPAEFSCDEAGDEDRDGESKCREDSEAEKGRTEEIEFDPSRPRE